MNPLSAIYGLGVAAKNFAYDRRLRKPAKLSWPVVSVGNLSVGGSGKTPFVILLGQLLRRQGYFITVLSRGYRRQSTAVELVDPRGESRRYGDEPLLIRRKLNAPVIVGAERYQCGLLAESRFAEFPKAQDSEAEPSKDAAQEAASNEDTNASVPRAVHILDDGFQHRRLARNFDIVLLPPSDLEDTLLPIGRLREGLGSLQRADAVILTSGTKRNDLPEFVREKAYVLERSLTVADAPKHPIAFCGVAKPERFFDDLRKLGIETAAEFSFRDHHRYSRQDLEMLLAKRKSLRADGFITTEKDRINLGEFATRLTPLAVAELRLRLVDEQAFLRSLLGALSSVRQ